MGFFTSPFGIAVLVSPPAGILILWGLGRVQDRHFGTGGALVLLGLSVVAAGYWGALATLRP